MHSGYRFALPAQTIGSAHPDVRPLLEKAEAQLGFLPNMYAVMANSPGLLSTYLDGYGRFRKASGFTPVEQEVVFLTISRTNGCDYCIAAHSMMADRVSKVPAAVTEAIRSGRAIPDARLHALSHFTETMLRSRGMPLKHDVDAFLAAGYAERHVLEIILAIAVKTLSNYANHLFHTPSDAAFEGYEWTTPTHRNSPQENLD